eukprot:CAMPEP_0184725274 /NCGR_PEP_ID=MMETSP0314-20130426/30483_1 /TAXON_ID=38298 /ORGANISM="Rhodella maculata, Strain CCMP 736" /LENGTH=50 /DNA_ID=CAMNT_0027190461 /DNA_START=163 /DNA_END=315 /DNA_ORIENTATION=-
MNAASIHLYAGCGAAQVSMSSSPKSSPTDPRMSLIFDISIGPSMSAAYAV